jgi:predicted Fe-Mo cluster-binding NifX family protein
MRIGIPILEDQGLNSQVSGHFGQAPYFMIVDIKSEIPKKGIIRDQDIISQGNDLSVIPNSTEHACGSLVEVLIENKVEILLIEGIGGRPFELLKQNNIKMYTGAFGTVKEVLRDFYNHMLPELQSASCEHHSHE